MIGIANAAVLPVPVCATPRTSYIKEITNMKPNRAPIETMIFEHSRDR